MDKHSITIYETDKFIKLSRKLLGNKERSGLFEHLKECPKSGDIIPGSGGIRKLRWKRPGMGKQGGVRVIYYLINEHGFISLLTVYAKSDKTDLTKQEIKDCREITELIKLELDGG